MENEGPKENPTQQKPEKPMSTNYSAARPKQPRPQEYYEDIKHKFAEERDLRLKYRPEGTKQYFSDFDGTPFERYEVDPFVEAVKPREPINDTVEMLVHRRRIFGAADRGASARGRRREHPHRRARRRCRRHLVLEPLSRRGLRCVAYDYLPLLDEMNYVPKRPLRQGAGDLRALPGDRAQIRSV